MPAGYKNLNSYIVKWVEQYLFFPTPFQHLVSILLLPFTVLYCLVNAYQRISKKPLEFGIPVISIGNLLVGGTGKTPVAIALGKYFKKRNIAVILRGYGRESKGLFVISKKGKIIEDVTVSGDEAMVLARSLPKATVIVSENRSQAILKARELGCDTVLLDDGYSKHEIKKYDILLRPAIEPSNIFCLPSGGYRDTKMMYSFANCVIKEDEGFKREVSLKKDNKIVDELPDNSIVLTAISKPERLLKYLPQDIKMISFPDHYNFTKEDIESIKGKYPDFNIITTVKDYVKLEKFNLKNIYLMDLEVSIEKEYLDKIEQYIQNYDTYDHL